MGYMNEFPHTRTFDSDLREILEMFVQCEKLPEQWNSFEILINGEVTELKNFVNNYFTNLDIQDEVNNKIDELVASGIIDALVLGYITPEMFGAVGDGISDDGEALHNMIDYSLTNNIPIKFPHSKLYISKRPLIVEMSADKKVFTLDGNKSRIYFTDCNGFEFRNIDDTTYGYVKDISMENIYIDGNNKDDTYGLIIGTANRGFDSGSDYLTFQNMGISGVGTSMKIVNSRKMQFIDIDFTPHYGACVELVATNEITDTQSFCGDLIFNGCEFSSQSETYCVNAHGGGTNSHFNEIRGIHFFDCIFYGQKGIDLSNTNCRKLDWFFNDCQFDQFNERIFYIVGGTEAFAYTGDIIINGCNFVGQDTIFEAYTVNFGIVFSNNTLHAPYIFNCWDSSNIVVTGNYIDGITSESGINGSSSDSVHDILISDNVIKSDDNFNVFKLYIGTRVKIVNNIFNSTIPIIGTSTTNYVDCVIKDNIYTGKGNTVDDIIGLS